MDLLGLFETNSAVKALSSGTPGLFMMNPQEEALITGASFRRMGRNMVLVKPNLYQAQDLYNRLYGLLGDDVLLYAVEESLQVEAIASSPETNAKKLETLITLLQSERPVLCVTHAAAVVRYLPQPEWFTHCMLTIRTDETYDMETLKKQLADAGYRYAKRVDSPMTFSFRGEVVDVFSTQYEQPIRIEFFDDVIDSIRTFDAVTQRTTGVVDHITIAPATDLLFTEEERKQLEIAVREKLEKDKKGLDQWDGEELESLVYQDLDMIAQHSSMNSLYKYRCYLENQATVLDYIKNPYVVLSCKEEVKEHLLHVNEETIQYIRELYQAKKALLKFMVFAELQDVLSGKTTYEISKFEPIREGIRTHVHPVSLPELTLSLALQEICKEAKEHRVLLCLQQDGIRKVIDECMKWDIPYVIVG
ncbi:MAG: transcription-repair coupling factor, partial [Erysipelotrichaceae bacterium]|nr:transcription-repair coupling factor [Erysipelotrichaceae bacterium]